MAQPLRGERLTPQPKFIKITNRSKKLWRIHSSFLKLTVQATGETRERGDKLQIQTY